MINTYVSFYNIWYLPQCGTPISKRTKIRISRVYDTRNFNPEKILRETVIHPQLFTKQYFARAYCTNRGIWGNSCHATSGVLCAGVAADYLQRVGFVGWACHFRSKQIWHSGSLKHGEWFHKTEFYVYAVCTNGRSGVDSIAFWEASKTFYSN